MESESWCERTHTRALPRSTKCERTRIHSHAQPRTRQKNKEGRTCSRSLICVWQHARVCAADAFLSFFKLSPLSCCDRRFWFSLVWQKWLMAVPLSVKDPRPPSKQEAMCSKSTYYRVQASERTLERNIQLMWVVKKAESNFIIFFPLDGTCQWLILPCQYSSFLHFTVFVLKRN